MASQRLCQVTRIFPESLPDRYERYRSLLWQRPRSGSGSSAALVANAVGAVQFTARACRQKHMRAGASGAFRSKLEGLSALDGSIPELSVVH